MDSHRFRFRTPFDICAPILPHLSARPPSHDNSRGAMLHPQASTLIRVTFGMREDSSFMSMSQYHAPYHPIQLEVTSTI